MWRGQALPYVTHHPLVGSRSLNSHYGFLAVTIVEIFFSPSLSLSVEYGQRGAIVADCLEDNKNSHVAWLFVQTQTIETFCYYKCQLSRGFEPPPPWCLQLKTDAKSFFSVPLEWPVVVQCHLEEKLLEWEWLVTIGALCQAHDRTGCWWLYWGGEQWSGRCCHCWRSLLLDSGADEFMALCSSSLHGFSEVTLVK